MKDDILQRDEAFDQLSIKQLRDKLHHPSRLIRARALAALARRSHCDEAITDDVLDAVTDAMNSEARLLGSTISVAHIGFAGLWEYGTPEAREALLRLLHQWPEPDRTDLLWFLKSQAIAIEVAQRDEIQT